MPSPGGDGGSDQLLDPAATQILRCRATLEAQDTDVKLHNVYEDTLTGPRLLIKNSSTPTANHNRQVFFNDQGSMVLSPAETGALTNELDLAQLWRSMELRNECTNVQLRNY